MRARGSCQRQRRLLHRLTVSVDTLLRLHLQLPQDTELSHSLPISPADTLRLLELLAAGQEIEVTSLEEEQ